MKERRNAKGKEEGSHLTSFFNGKRHSIATLVKCTLFSPSVLSHNIYSISSKALRFHLKANNTISGITLAATKTKDQVTHTHGSQTARKTGSPLHRVIPNSDVQMIVQICLLVEHKSQLEAIFKLKLVIKNEEETMITSENKERIHTHTSLVLRFLNTVAAGRLSRILATRPKRIHCKIILLLWHRKMGAIGKSGLTNEQCSLAQCDPRID